MFIKYPKLTLIIKLLMAILMFGTAALFFLGRQPGDDMQQSEKLANFMKAMVDSGYIPAWISGFKIVAAILLIIPRTQFLAGVMCMGYTVNIFLYTLYIAPQFLHMSTFLVIANIYLCYAFWDWYKVIFKRAQNYEKLNKNTLSSETSVDSSITSM